MNSIMIRVNLSFIYVEDRKRDPNGEPPSTQVLIYRQVEAALRLLNTARRIAA
jgi:hypothetical protein